VIFAGDCKKITQEFAGNHSYLRQKPAFKNTPLAVLTDGPMLYKYALEDNFVRAYNMDAGFFVPLIGFFKAIQNGQLKPLVDTQKVEAAMAKAFTSKFGSGVVFTPRAASNDEAHSEFMDQYADEIASNLIWVKYSARILIDGSEKFLASMKSIPEDERTQIAHQTLANAFEEFAGLVTLSLEEEGALFFAKSAALSNSERSPFLKKAKSQSVLYESPFCRILVEFTRYL
jgi:hypothetical protein